MVYYLLFDELRKELGEQKAVQIMRRAIERRGRQVGEEFTRFAPDDLKGLCEAYLKSIPGESDFFAAEVERCDADVLELQIRRCPIKDAWIEAGVCTTDVAKLCEIVSARDCGVFEGAGFRFFSDPWTPGGDGCCHLHVRPRRKSARTAR